MEDKLSQEALEKFKTAKKTFDNFSISGEQAARNISLFFKPSKDTYLQSLFDKLGSDPKKPA